MYAYLSTLPHAGIVGCKLLNADASVQTSCIQSIPTLANQLLNSELLRARWPKSRLWGVAALFDNGDEPREVEVVSGACLMTTRKAFQDVGRFSEEYFMYGEDVDLSHKMRTTGYKNYYVPRATVIHYGGISSQHAASVFSAVMIPEATCRFLRKTRGTGYSLMYRLTMLVSAIGRLVLLGVAWITGSGTPSTATSLRKWFSILQWSVRRDGVVEQVLSRSLTNGVAFAWHCHAPVATESNCPPDKAMKVVLGLGRNSDICRGRRRRGC